MIPGFFTIFHSRLSIDSHSVNAGAECNFGMETGSDIRNSFNNIHGNFNTWTKSERNRVLEISAILGTSYSLNDPSFSLSLFHPLSYSPISFLYALMNNAPRFLCGGT